MRVLQLFLSLILTATCFGQYLKPIRGMPFVDRTNLSARGLVGYWLFNEGSGNIVFDLSENGNIGTFVADTHWVPGKFGPALSFDGAGDYVDLGSGESLSTQVFTISSLIYTIGSTTRAIKAHTQGLPYGGISFRVEDDNRLGLIKQNVVLIGYSTDTISNLTWTHVAVTYDSSGNYIFYINGIDAGSGNNAQTFIFGEPHAIGRGASPGGYFNGLIDHVLIHNRVLPASEIAELYWKPFCMMKQPNPLLYAREVVAPPPPSGQVITIQMSIIPLFFIFTLVCLIKGRKVS